MWTAADMIALPRAGIDRPPNDVETPTSPPVVAKAISYGADRVFCVFLPRRQNVFGSQLEPGENIRGNRSKKKNVQTKRRGELK